MDLREVYKKEEGMFTVCSDADGNIYSTEDYVEWLEEKLVKLLTIPVVVGESEQLAEHNHKFYVNADWTSLNCECGKKIKHKG